MSIGRYITYQLVYNEEPPENPLDLLAGFDKKDLLVILASINNYPKRDLTYHSISKKDQLFMIYWIIGESLKSKAEEIQELVRIFLFDSKRDFVLFHRTASLVAMNQILLNEIPTGEKSLHPESIIKYYLAINSQLEKYQENNRTDDDEFMDIILTMIATNEYNAPFIPILQLFRGIKLVMYLRKHENYKEHFDGYIKQLGVDPFLLFMFILSAISEVVKNKDIHRLPLMNNPSHLRKITSVFLDHHSNSENLLEILGIKTAPFYKYADDSFIVLDLSLLADFCYHSFINKFWFEYVKPLTKETAKSFFSVRGRFFEEHVASLLSRSFSYLKYPGPKVLDALKVVHPNTGSEVELCDFFIKENKKILLGEIKSSLVANPDKYSKEYRDETNENESNFNKRFGITQIVKSIKYLIENPDLFYSELNQKHRYRVYPSIVLQERAFIAPFVHIKVQEHFRHELKNVFSDIVFPEKEWNKIIYKNLVISPLTLINVLTIELLTPEFEQRKLSFWKFLDRVHKEKSFDPPFFHAYNQSNTDYYDAFPEVREILREYDEERKAQRNQS